jgi:hypothetical protein
MFRDLFETKAQRIAAYRAAWLALGTFLSVWIGAWLLNDAAGALDKTVIGPALVAVLPAIFGRGFVEGSIDKGNTTIKPSP